MAETDTIENEIRITLEGKIDMYVSSAINILKREITGLSQATTVGSIEIKDARDSMDDDFYQLETTQYQHVEVIAITLSKDMA